MTDTATFNISYETPEGQLVTSHRLNVGPADDEETYWDALVRVVNERGIKLIRATHVQGLQ